MENTLKRTWAEIDLDHLTHNFEVIRRHVGDKVKLLGVVKADGYGHGAVEIAKRLEQLGAGYLAVSNIDECEELRDSGVTLPILMLGFTPADQTARILQLHMTQAVQSYDIAKEFSDRAIALGGKMTVHVKLDTGMAASAFRATRRTLTRVCATFCVCSNCRDSTSRECSRTSACRTRTRRRASNLRNCSMSASRA